jgi:hypothetical protein
LEALAHLREVDFHFLASPLLTQVFISHPSMITATDRSTYPQNIGEKVHTPALNPLYPLEAIIQPQLLQTRMTRPPTNWDFEPALNDIDESSLDHSIPGLVDDPQ